MTPEKDTKGDESALTIYDRKSDVISAINVYVSVFVEILNDQGRKDDGSSCDRIESRERRTSDSLDIIYDYTINSDAITEALSERCHNEINGIHTPTAEEIYARGMVSCAILL